MSILLGSYSSLKLQLVEDFGNKFASFEKIDPLRGNFQNSVPKGFTTSLIHVLYVNFVEFGQPEVAKQ